MAEQNSTSKRKGNRRWVRVVLFVSLAVNLLVVGLVVGALLSGPHGRDRPELRGLGYGPFVRALSKEERSALHEALARNADSFRHNRAELRAQFEALLMALRTEPFDAAEVERLFAEQRDRILERRRLGQASLLERIMAMSPQDRAAYADALDRKFRRRDRE